MEFCHSDQMLLQLLTDKENIFAFLGNRSYLVKEKKRIFIRPSLQGLSFKLPVWQKKRLMIEGFVKNTFVWHDK